MALRSTIYKAQLELADLNRSHFEGYSLTLARHPSETEERLMMRVLAYALFAREGLEFGKGLSDEDEAALWQFNDVGEVKLWIDVGLPDEDRIKKASHKADQAVVLAYGRSAPLWWSQINTKLSRFENLTVLNITDSDSTKLTALAERGMKLNWTIQGETVYLGEESIEPRQWMGRASHWKRG